jgi:hypothetical protein
MHWSFWIILIVLILFLNIVETNLSFNFTERLIINGIVGFMFPTVVRSIFYRE